MSNRLYLTHKALHTVQCYSVREAKKERARLVEIIVSTDLIGRNMALGMVGTVGTMVVVDSLAFYYFRKANYEIGAD
jgi:hypothetical protein